MPTQKFVTQNQNETQDTEDKKALKTPKSDKDSESKEKMKRSEDVSFFSRIRL